MTMRLSLTGLLCLLTAAGLAPSIFAQEGPAEIPLWEDGAPGFEERRTEPELAEDYWVRNVHDPSITAYLPPPDSATGAAVVIAPGGGHRLLVITSEGREAAEFLNSIGVAAFVLKYRLMREEGSPYTLEEHARQDARRALRLVRHRSGEWGVDPDRVGIMGFSAGGEVAAMVAYDDGRGDPSTPDPIDRRDGSPDFQVLVYPGPLGIPERVDADAPPAFIAVAGDDECCSAPALELLQRYYDAGASVEAHVYARGGHAFNMGRRADLISLQKWPQRLTDWMRDNYILEPRPSDE